MFKEGDIVRHVGSSGGYIIGKVVSITDVNHFMCAVIETSATHFILGDHYNFLSYIFRKVWDIEDNINLLLEALDQLEEYYSYESGI